jgi:hypothetical protein
MRLNYARPFCFRRRRAEPEAGTASGSPNPAKIQTGGKQTVVVQHVRVSDGGQAVVAGQMNATNPGVSREQEGEACGKRSIPRVAAGSNTATHRETSRGRRSVARGTDAGGLVRVPPCETVVADCTAVSAPARKPKKESNESAEHANLSWPAFRSCTSLHRKPRLDRILSPAARRNTMREAGAHEGAGIPACCPGAGVTRACVRYSPR